MVSVVIFFFFTAVFGWAATIIPRAYTYYISTALFAIFGLKMLRDGYYMSPNEGQEELEEVQSDLRKREDEASFQNDNHVNPWCVWMCDALLSFCRMLLLLTHITFLFHFFGGVSSIFPLLWFRYILMHALLTNVNL